MAIDNKLKYCQDYYKREEGQFYDNTFDFDDGTHSIACVGDTFAFLLAALSYMERSKRERFFRVMTAKHVDNMSDIKSNNYSKGFMELLSFCSKAVYNAQPYDPTVLNLIAAFAESSLGAYNDTRRSKEQS